MTRLYALLRHPQFRIGIQEMAPVSVGTAAWGLVTGVAMVKSGLSIPLSLLMTFTVFAGSAQLAAIPLMAVNTPLWVIWATAFCVNLRFLIFSAQWRPFFMRYPLRTRLALGYLGTDITYVFFMRRYTEPKEGEGQIEYYLGSCAANFFSWQVASVLGILLADIIPTHWGLGFAGVLALLGMTYSLITDRATVLATVVAGCAAVAAFALPYRLNILVAIASAVCIGVIVDSSASAGRRPRTLPEPETNPEASGASVTARTGEGSR